MKAHLWNIKTKQTMRKTKWKKKKIELKFWNYTPKKKKTLSLGVEEARKILLPHLHRKIEKGNTNLRRTKEN